MHVRSKSLIFCFFKNSVNCKNYLYFSQNEKFPYQTCTMMEIHVTSTCFIYKKKKIIEKMLDKRYLENISNVQCYWCTMYRAICLDKQQNALARLSSRRCRFMLIYDFINSTAIDLYDMMMYRELLIMLNFEEEKLS